MREESRKRGKEGRREEGRGAFVACLWCAIGGVIGVIGRVFGLRGGEEGCRAEVTGWGFAGGNEGEKGGGWTDGCTAWDFGAIWECFLLFAVK